MSKRNVATNGAANAKAAVVGNFGLIVDQPKLMSLITSTHRSQAKLDKTYHMIACASLLMAAQHGQVAPLNALYNGLKPAMQSALKAWVGYVCSDMPFPRQGMGEGQGWLRAFDSKEGEKPTDGFFRVIKDRKDQRNLFVSQVETIVKGSDPAKGGTGHKYMEKNLTSKGDSYLGFVDQKLDASNVNAFNPVQILSRLESLRRLADKPENNIDPQISQILDNAYKQIDAMIPDAEIIGATHQGNLGPAPAQVH